MKTINLPRINFIIFRISRRGWICWFWSIKILKCHSGSDFQSFSSWWTSRFITRSHLSKEKAFEILCRMCLNKKLFIFVQKNQRLGKCSNSDWGGQLSGQDGMSKFIWRATKVITRIIYTGIILWIRNIFALGWTLRPEAVQFNF